MSCYGNRNQFNDFYPYNGDGYYYGPYRNCGCNRYYPERGYCGYPRRDEVVVDVHVEAPDHHGRYYY